MSETRIPVNEEYKYGFHDEDVSIYNTGKGLTRDTILAISHKKKCAEPQWMLDFRLRAFEQFESMDIQTWSPDVTNLDFDDYTYYIKPSDKTEKSWEDVPDTIKDTFDKLGIPEAEKEFLAGVTTQYDSEAVYHNMLEEVESKGVIFLDTDTA